MVLGTSMDTWINAHYLVSPSKKNPVDDSQLLGELGDFFGSREIWWLSSSLRAASASKNSRVAPSEISRSWRYNFKRFPIISHLVTSSYTFLVYSYAKLSVLVIHGRCNVLPGMKWFLRHWHKPQGKSSLNQELNTAMYLRLQQVANPLCGKPENLAKQLSEVFFSAVIKQPKTGVLHMTSTQTIQGTNCKGNPSKLPYICMKCDSPRMIKTGPI